jgi:alkylhydroperoxidase/carboxymuconolactone decarboxylase family protein YurZ
MAAPAPVPAPSLEERERVLAAREEAVRAQERALESRAQELAERESRLLRMTEELAADFFRHQREVEFNETFRDTLRWQRRALDRRWRRLHNASVALASRVEAFELDGVVPPPLPRDWLPPR